MKFSIDLNKIQMTKAIALLKLFLYLSVMNVAKSIRGRRKKQKQTKSTSLIMLKKNLR